MFTNWIHWYLTIIHVIHAVRVCLETNNLWCYDKPWRKKTDHNDTSPVTMLNVCLTLYGVTKCLKSPNLWCYHKLNIILIQHIWTSPCYLFMYASKPPSINGVTTTLVHWYTYMYLTTPCCASKPTLPFYTVYDTSHGDVHCTRDTLSYLRRSLSLSLSIKSWYLSISIEKRNKTCTVCLQYHLVLAYLSL